VPNHATWDDLDRIVDVLTLVGKIPDLNHMLLPWGGGMDLLGAESSAREPGCVELITPGMVYLVKAERLRFESFNDDPQGNYLWLDTVDLRPSGVYPGLSDHRLHEELIDVGGEIYADWSCWDADMYDGRSLPKGSRRVARCFRGSFLILQKTSIYNGNPQIYDGRHNKMGADGFRMFYEPLVSASLRKPS
jgi:hypothetical protein